MKDAEEWINTKCPTWDEIDFTKPLEVARYMDKRFIQMDNVSHGRIDKLNTIAWEICNKINTRKEVE